MTCPSIGSKIAVIIVVIVGLTRRVSSPYTWECADRSSDHGANRAND
jgi:hypothetical protein